MKASDIPDNQIRYAGENKYASYYRIADQITVTVRRDSQNALVFTCLTDRTNDCVHTRAVEWKCTPANREAA